uniref:strawberry notch C-terminal domain-containing protein n=1 Tax=uncultured Desulfovibrio sp. TaxID=167968 RepID=UPI0026306728
MARKSKNLPTYNPQDFVAGFDSFDLSQFVGTGQPTAQAAKPQAQGEGGESPGIMKDMEYSLAAGIDDLGATGFYGLEKAAEFAGIDWLTNLARSGRQYFNTRAEGQRKAMSPEMRAARQKKFVEEDAEGTITGFGSAWGDPRAILGTVAESAPSMIASLAPSAVMAKGLMNLGLSRGLAWAIGSGVGEGGVGGLQNSKDVYEQVMAMDEAKLQDSPEYQAYRVTMDPDDAKRALANDIALKVFGTTGAATAVLGAPMGMVFGRALGGETGKTLARTMGKQAIGEALEETGQSGAETYLSQLELQRADTSINPMSGVANAAVAGGIAGGFMGGGMGAPAHFIGRRRAADNLIRDAENDNPEPGQPGGPTVPPEQAVNPGSAGEVFSGPEWNAPEVRPDLDAEWNRQARERGWDHLSSEKPVQPYVSPDAFLSQQEMDDIEAFVRAFEERERMQDDIDALTEYGQRKQTSPVQAALSSGQAVDLLALPAGNAAMPMGTNAPSGPAIATPTDYAGTPIATPYIPRPALPSDTGGQNYVGQWTGGASQLSYPYGDMAQGVTGGLMPQTIDITASPASAAPTVEQVAPDDLTPYQRQMLMLAEQEATPSAPSLAPTQTPALPQSGALPVWAQQEAAREREREAQRQEQAAEEERRHQELLARIPEGQREKVADWPLERLENALEQYDAEMLAERMEVEIANGNAAIGDTLRAFYRDELLAGRKVTKAMARAKAREVIQRDGLTVTPEDMRIQIGKALWEGGDEALEAEAAKGGDNLVERLHSILENLPKDIKKSYLTRLRFKAGSLAKAAQERDAEGGQDGIQAGPEEKPVQQQTELERRKEIMRDLAAAYDWDKMKRMPTSKLEELHADYMAQKRKPAERAPEGATDKDGAYIKHDGWWYTKGSDGQAKDRLGVSYQDRLESEWRAAQGNDSAQPSPAPAEEQPQAAAAPERSYGTPDAPDTIALADHFAEQFMQGKRYKTILEARREVGRLLGGTAIPKGQALKTVDEAIELGIVQAARKTAADMRADGKSDVEIFRAMVDLYERQPNLGTRTSTSVAEQAYSTPVPLSFLASRLARIGKNSRVYEPTAGNGSLLIEVSPGNATVNELNGGRAERLRSQGFTVTQKDAAQYAPDGKVDVVIENPPFGRVWNDSHTETVELDVDGFTTKEIDQAIVAKSLQALKDNGKGRAVLIIGGKQGGPEARKTKYRAASQVRFWGHLFDNYHILEHFSIDGKLYSRQGASYPIDVIVLDTNGTSAGRTYPGAELPRMYSSFEELEELFNEREMDRAGTSVSSDNAGAGVVQEGQGGESGGTSANPRVAPADASGTGRGRAGEAGGERASASGRREGNAEGTERPEHGARSGREGDSREGLGSDRRPSGRSGSAVGEADDNGGRGLPDSRGQARKTESGAVGEPDRLGEKHSGLEVAQKPNKQAPVQQKATEFQAPYKKTSSLPSMGTLVPKNMVTAVSNAMKALEKEHGKIDDYVSEELGYKPGELGNYFAAEQVDALGLAIHNLSKGAGFIIGDQTGIGKGRVNAGIIRWAKQHGKTPVFITCSNTLYGDMVRDLADIGMDGFTPLPTNPDLSGKDAIPLPDGRTLTTPGAAKHGALLAQVSEEGLGDYDAVFTTYKQLSSDPKGTRRRFLQNLAPNAVFILDESHNGGSANAGSDRFKKKNDNSESLAVFIRKLLNSCPNGTFYSSATYAKRPDLMDLYSKTDMRFAVNDIKALGEAIARGGIPMQQVVAAELTEAGQYIRRERTWEGADVETVSVKTDAARADASAEALRVIMEFDRAKQTKLKAIKDAEAGSGGTAYDNKSANEKAMQSASFSSVMHNLIAQGLLAQKVDAIVDAADAALKRGEKPVITLSNTMGAPIDDYAKNNAAKAGDPIDMTFKDMYLRYLDKARTVTKKDKNGNVIERRLLTDDELGPEALDLYNNARDIINESGLDALPLSIIDSIEHGLRQRGYKVGEITGRKMGIDYSGAQPVLASVDSSNKNKARVINEFNSGELDVVVLNAAGSTGISLHASENFKDQRRRTMIIAQPDLNIDTFMQTLGRIFRTGQVVPPKYQLLFTDIPAEKRPAAILAKKMASLNANTTAAKDSDASFKNIPDFMNKYGDRVAKQVMAENTELHERMGAPLDKEGVDGGDMQRLTGYIPLLPVKDQQKVYDLLESEYNELIAQHEAMGTLDLEAKTLPLDAKLIREEVVQPAKTDLSVSDSPFAAAAMIGEYDVKRLGHPFSSAKVKDFVRKAKPVDVDAERKKMRAFVEKRLARIKDDERRDANRERLEGAFQAFNSIVRKFSVGDPVMVNNNREQQHIPGVIIGIYRDEKVENPLALSSWKMDVAIADAAKRIVFPFSQLSKETHEEDATTVEPYGVSLSEAYEAFDNGQSESRERVFIATGNILSAYERLHVGKVIQFEDHGGNIIPGLQMPRDTTLSALLDAVDMALTPEQSLRFLERLGSGKGAVKTEDKHFVLTRDDSGYNIAVPASKKDGAQYFLNGGILRAAGEDFVKSGQSMVLRGMDSKQTAAVLKVMADQGYGFVADNNKDMAREITGQRKSDEKPLASVAPSAHLPPVGKARRGMKADALRRVADKLGGIAKNAATARVVQSFDELPASIREAHKNARTTLEGVFDPRSGAVYLVADNLTSESRAAEVWAHEQVVHHGLRSIL